MDNLFKWPVSYALSWGYINDAAHRWATAPACVRTVVLEHRKRMIDVNDGDKKVYDSEGRQGEKQRILLKLASCLQWPLFLQNGYYKELNSFSSSWNSIWGKAGQALQSLSESLSVRVEPQVLPGELCVEKRCSCKFWKRSPDLSQELTERPAESWEQQRSPSTVTLLKAKQKHVGWRVPNRIKVRKLKIWGPIFLCYVTDVPERKQHSVCLLCVWIKEVSDSLTSFFY